jgi:hypothetical protein
MISKKPIFRLMETLFSFLARAWPSSFAYNFLVIAQRMDDLEDIYQETLKSRDKE